MTDELIPDNPHLQQIDALFRQMAQGGATPTKNDIEYAGLLADIVRLWAGIPILPPEEHEEATRGDSRGDSPPPDTPQTWADFIGQAQRNASVRKN
jgi:hypothetical protein